MSKRLTFSRNGEWGIEGVDLSTLPPQVYGALCKLKDIESAAEKMSTTTAVHNDKLIEAAIAYFEDAIRESDEIIADCTPALQAELEEQKGYFAVALEAMRRAPLPEDNPLTLEELRGMDGEPVWVVARPDWGHWELSECAEDYFEDRDEDFYGMTMPPALPDPMGRYGLHMLGWLAYRRPPEKGE